MVRLSKKCAIELVSDIGSKAFDLQHHSDEEIAEAVALLRDINGPMFDWLVRVLSGASEGNQPRRGLRGDPAVPRTVNADSATDVLANKTVGAPQEET